MAIKRITTNLIKDSDIATVDIANNAITAAKITDGNITTAKLADLSVTAGKLAGTLDLTGKTITVATATTGDNDTSPASTAFVQQEIAALVDSSPDSLNTLNELAAALGDDASFSTTVTNSIASKLPLAGGTLTGALTTNGVINTGTSHNFALNTPNSLRINIDSNNSATDQIFVIGHNQTSVDNNNALMTILESGNVGIGTSSPNANLHIGASAATGNATNPALQIGGASTYRLGMYTGAEDAIIENKNGDDGIAFRVKTAGEAMRIDGGTGNVGIGGSPDTQLNIKNGDDAVVRIESTGSESGDDARLEIKTTNGTFTIQNDRSLGTSGALTFAGNTSDNLVIDHNDGTVGIGVSTPSGSGVLGTGHKLVTRANTNSGYVTTGGTGRLPAGLEIATQNIYQANDSLSGFAMQSNGAGGATMGGYIGFLPASTFGGGSVVIGATTGSNSHAERIRITNEGITFNGDTAAANALDDYEVGTWSPTLGNSANINSLSLTEAGRYVKVGNLVHLEFQITGSFVNAAVESRFQFSIPFNTATTSSRATGMFAHHLTSFSDARFNNGQVFQGSTQNSNLYVYISTNQLSGTGSFTGRTTVTYVAG